MVENNLKPPVQAVVCAVLINSKYRLGDLNIRTVTAFYETFREKNRSESTVLRYHNDLRHSCASMLIANHASLKEVQMWLGHSTITTTADVYGHLDESAKNRIGDAMQKLLCPDEGEDD